MLHELISTNLAPAASFRPQYSRIQTPTICHCLQVELVSKYSLTSGNYDDLFVNRNIMWGDFLKPGESSAKQPMSRGTSSMRNRPGRPGPQTYMQLQTPFSI
jgi:hypothetical protein